MLEELLDVRAVGQAPVGEARHEGERFTLKGEEGRQLPGTLGDPYRAVGLLPGVSTPVPLLPLYVIRGASPGMNGFFLDGVPFLGWFFETARLTHQPAVPGLHHAVHHGQHHGWQATMLALTALGLSRLPRPRVLDAYLALMLAYGYIKTNWQQAVDLYTRQCSIGVNAKDLAMMAATLANMGKNPVTGKQVLDAGKVPNVLAVMARFAHLMPGCNTRTAPPGHRSGPDDRGGQP